MVCGHGDGRRKRVGHLRSHRAAGQDPRCRAEGVAREPLEICSVPNLHAKVSLIDTTWGLVGSGNLTNSGLGGDGRANVELGVTLDAGQIAAAKLFGRWWDDA